MSRRNSQLYLEPGSYAYYRERWRTWALRGFALVFVTFGLLAIARALRHHGTLDSVVWAVIYVVGGTAIAMGALSYSYAMRFRLVRRREGGNFWR